MSNGKAIRVRSEEYQALERVRDFHFHTTEVPFHEVIRMLLAEYVEHNGLGVDI